MLEEVTASDVTGAENRCDLIRLLLHREYNRRKGLPKPHPKDWQGVYRVGGHPVGKKNLLQGAAPDADQAHNLNAAGSIPAPATNLLAEAQGCTSQGSSLGGIDTRPAGGALEPVVAGCTELEHNTFPSGRW